MEDARRGRGRAGGMKPAPIAYVLAASLALGPAAAAAAAMVEHLYEAQVIVTGQREDTRSAGLAEALLDVLVKVSGDPRLLGDPRAAEVAAKAGTFVEGFRYHDRMAGIPVHDEQGTRDRPYDLVVDFDPARIDAALRSLGRAPWAAARPRLVLFLRVRTKGGGYVLASDGDRGRDQRESLADAAGRFGMPITLPSAAALGGAGLTVETLPAAAPSRLDAVAQAAGGDLALAGSLAWSDEAPGWISDWHLLVANGGSYRWGDRGGNFDQAFRRAATGAEQILSGNGQPD
jgi:uncharacterized protein